MGRTARWPLASGVALAIAALGASAAAAPATVLDDPRLGAARAPIAAAVDAAQRDGLPSAPLLDKVAEGLAKGVPPARVAQAVQSFEAALSEGRAIAAARLSLAPAALPSA